MWILPNEGSALGVKLPELLPLEEEDLPIPAPHEHCINVGGDAGEALLDTLGVAGQGPHVRELPVLVPCTNVIVLILCVFLPHQLLGFCNIFS